MYANSTADSEFGESTCGLCAVSGSGDNSGQAGVHSCLGVRQRDF